MLYLLCICVVGANFVSESLRCDEEGFRGSSGREIRFLANVDPVAVTRALDGLKPEATIAVVISKTFTTRGQHNNNRRKAEEKKKRISTRLGLNREAEMILTNCIVCCLCIFFCAETILNAKTVREWFVKHLGKYPIVNKQHGSHYYLFLQGYIIFFLFLSFSFFLFIQVPHVLVSTWLPFQQI